MTATSEVYQAQTLWHHIFGEERGLLHIWTAIRDSDERLFQPRSYNFNYPDAAAAAAQWALEKSEEGREVYFCAHLLIGAERRRENAGSVQALWFEKDGGKVPNGRLAPSAVVESSPGRYHGFLRLTDPIPPETAEALNKCLAHATGADPSGADRTQLLRVPGTVNHKYDDQPTVKILGIRGDRAYTPAELEAILLPAADAEKRTAPEVSDRIARGGRNKELTSIAGTMRRRGLEEEELAAALLAVNARRCDPPLEDAEVEKIARSVSRYEPAENGATLRIAGHRVTRGAEPSFNLTDLGNAGRLIHRHGANLRYCWLWGKWFVWVGTRWIKDDTGEVLRLAKETVASIYQEAAAAPDDETRKALAKHAMRSEAGARIKEMVDLARSDVPVMPDELDASADLLNTQNGTLDLRRGELREHRREDLMTKIAPVAYRPDAAAPAWEDFLERVLPSEELRGFVQRAVGYSATGDTSEQCLFINHGGGANGKSTFQEAVSTALGDYAMRAPTEMLLARRTGGIPNDVARLKGSRFVAASETEEGRRLAESLIKDLTGQDTITARFMRAEFFDFKPTHKLWLSTNHKPEIRGTDNAIWRRIRLVPWTVTIPPPEQDKKLLAKLRAELPGVLAWIVRGCLEWRRGGLQAPDEVRKATGAYRAEMDVLSGFIAECCVLGAEHWDYAKDLYASYKRWCDETGERSEAQRKFGGRLGERGFIRDRGGSRGAGIWRGLRLTEAATARGEGMLTLRKTGFSSSSDPTDPEIRINTRKL